MVDEEKHSRIKEALRLRGLSLSDIARAHEVKQSTVSLVSTGWRRSRRLESAIAAALDLAPEEIWPDRYI
ncbi:helix-turn-helix domain-containing protein [Caulobacter henricii]|uniref:helix-turn-helix domain-containing protein n=1 Tax=Caulobacter henricii TaxID=69395 RepID=UPI000A06D80F|nr:helix-turn-helix domain-containing protein [Caulobacter henricii]